MNVNIENIINFIKKLGLVYNSPLNYIVSMAYDLERLMQLVSKDLDLYNKFLNFIDIPSTVLNEKTQVRRDFLKQVISEIYPNNNVTYRNEISKNKLNSIKYICFDNILIATKKISNIIESNNTNVQIVVSNNKIRKLIKYQFGFKSPINDIPYKDNPQIKKIVKILNEIVVEQVTTGNLTISDISTMRNDCDLTIFFGVPPSTAWSNNIGYLWLFGHERELLGLTTRIDWNYLLNISPVVYIFCKQSDVPLWQQIHKKNVEYLEVTYSELDKNTADSDTLPIANLKTELTVNANGVSDLLHNPYLFYLKNILDLKPKKHFMDDTSKVFDIFNKLLKNGTTEQQLSELKNIDYFYYKKIQSFVKKIPSQQPFHYHVTIDGLTVIYKNNYFLQDSNITEFDYYTLSSSLSAKDIISGYKTDLMVQAMSTKTDAVKFNVISPDWHSPNGVNKRSIELSKEISNEYKNNIQSAWSNFLKTDIFKLKIDKVKLTTSYKHLERIQ